MLVSVIIVSYNVREFLKQCLDSVQKAEAGLGKESEIIVIDNYSTDGSREWLQTISPRVKIIFNNENIGFARACNQGIRQSTGDYLLFLNPDTVIPPDCLQKCIAFFEKHHDAGAIGVKMVNGKGKFLMESKRGFPSPAASFYKLSGMAKIFPRSPVFAKYYLGHLDENSNHEVDIISGAFMFVRKDVLNRTGLFDEDFFMYGEDIDLSYRIQRAGYKNYYFADTTIVHFKGKSTAGKKAGDIKMFYGAMNIFVKKHYAREKNFLFLLFIKTGIWTRMIIALAGHFLTNRFNRVNN